MAILITGGKGFVGSALVSFLEERGQTVILFERDISNRGEVLKFKPAQHINTIIHLAGVLNERDGGVYQRINIDGTKNIVDLGKKIGVDHLIFVSSIRVLSSFSDPYIDSKREAEKIIVNSGLPYIILRPSLIYGPDDDKNIGFFIKAAKCMPIMPSLNFKIQPIFIDDIIKIIDACLSYQSKTVLNITGREVITYDDLLKNLKSLNYKFYIVNLPVLFSFALRLFSFLPFSPFTPWQIRGLLSNEVFNSSSWPEIFNIKPTLFSEGILKTIKY